MSDRLDTTLSFSDLITSYKQIQDRLVDKVRRLAQNPSGVSPGDFILLQFQMAQVTQMGESISNLIAQVNSIIGTTIRNQKTQ